MAWIDRVCWLPRRARVSSSSPTQVINFVNRSMFVREERCLLPLLAIPVYGAACGACADEAVQLRHLGGQLAMPSDRGWEQVWKWRQVRGWW
jgi:hypothetical protein